MSRIIEPGSGDFRAPNIQLCPLWLEHYPASLHFVPLTCAATYLTGRFNSISRKNRVRNECLHGAEPATAQFVKVVCH